MGISLVDRDENSRSWHINFWNWRAIVEEIRRARVIDALAAAQLHQPYCGYGLTRDESRKVAGALRQLAANLAQDERILLDGRRATTADDGVFHRPESGLSDENYSTSRKVLESFVAFCEKCEGFEVC